MWVVEGCTRTRSDMSNAPYSVTRVLFSDKHVECAAFPHPRAEMASARCTNLLRKRDLRHNPLVATAGIHHRHYILCHTISASLCSYNTRPFPRRTQKETQACMLKRRKTQADMRKSIPTSDTLASACFRAPTPEPSSSSTAVTCVTIDMLKSPNP